MEQYLPDGNKLKGSHARQCSICKHSKCKDIEFDYLTGRAVNKIIKDYELNQTAFYNHMNLRGFVEWRRKNPDVRIHALSEELQGEVVYRGSDVTKLLEMEAKIEKKLGPEQEINITQNLGNFMEKFKNVPESEVDRMLEGLLNGTESET